MGSEGSKPAPIYGTDYDPAGYLPPGLYDTTQIWDATGVKAKHCNNPLFTRWFPDYMYGGFGDPPFDTRAYPCAWSRNLPYNAWFVNSKWYSPAEGTPMLEKNKPTGKTWENPWGPYPYGNNFFCVLEEADGISQGSKSVKAGNWGEVFPKCFQSAGVYGTYDRLYFTAVNDAQLQFREGHMDDVTEINRNDPFNRDPCGGRSSLAMLVPWALTVVLGVGTSVLLRYVVFDEVPAVSLTALSVGAAGFGWNFGQAIQAKSRDRDYYVSSASTFLGASIGVSGAVIGGYVLLPDWQKLEIPLIVGGGVTGYYYLAPMIEPSIGTGGGLLGSVFGFLNTVVGGLEKFFCGIANWDIDGCSPEKNETARSWDRVLLAAAGADSLAKSYGLDDKEKEVAFQALLVNAANFNAFDTPTDKMEQLMQFNTARSWVVQSAPRDTPDDKPTNSFASMGHVVQPELLPLEETQMQAWVQHLLQGQERNNKYMQTMFEKGEGALLQKCDTFASIEEKPQVARWMDLAYEAAQKGRLAPTNIGVPYKLFNCKIIYSDFLQRVSWEAGVEFLADWEKDFNKQGIDFLHTCKQTDKTLYFVLYAIVSAKEARVGMGGGNAPLFVELINSFVLSKVPAEVQTPEFYSFLIATLEKWHISSAVANNAAASEIWRRWVRAASGGVVTECDIALAKIEDGDNNWRALGAKAVKEGAVGDCTAVQRGKLEAYQLFDKTTTCTNAVGYEKLQFQNAPYDNQYKCGVGAAFSRAEGFNCNADAQNTIDSWVAACSQ